MPVAVPRNANFVVANASGAPGIQRSQQRQQLMRVSMRPAAGARRTVADSGQSSTDEDRDTEAEQESCSESEGVIEPLSARILDEILDDAEGDAFERNPADARHRSAFDQRFRYTDSKNIGLGLCEHPSNLPRPCRYCLPKVDRPLFELAGDIFEHLFSTSALQAHYPSYRPLNDSVVLNHFQAITAMHNLDYIRQVLGEVENWIAWSLNTELDADHSEQVATDLLWLHEQVKATLTRLKTDYFGSCPEQVRALQGFRDRIQSLGFAAFEYENFTALSGNALGCHR